MLDGVVELILRERWLRKSSERPRATDFEKKRRITRFVSWLDRSQLEAASDWQHQQEFIEAEGKTDDSNQLWKQVGGRKQFRINKKKLFWRLRRIRELPSEDKRSQYKITVLIAIKFHEHNFVRRLRGLRATELPQHDANAIYRVYEQPPSWRQQAHETAKIC
jgi:hypothetical protein